LNARQKTIGVWLGWVAFLLAMTAYLTHRWRGPDRTAFLPGPTSHGHYQIELACNACHTPWMGVKEKACLDCHSAELKLANDSHPKSKFTDPRNADRLQVLAADNCLTCHKEHVPERTRAMGVMLPDDYCYRCHQETVKERPSHRNYAFNSCATAGCHNYHDNTALYEDFLVKHLNEPKTKSAPRVATRALLAFLNESERWPKKPALTVAKHDAPASVRADKETLHAWATTSHARAGVNCSDCHLVPDAQSKTKRWSDKLDHTACAACHQDEVGGFLAGKHGMRLAQGLPPMRPALARQPMKREAAHRELGCAACHGAHEFDSRRAAVESCLACHDDSHSLAYKNSPHFALWVAESKGAAPAGSGVSCATCHLPRQKSATDGVTRVLVDHNQNANLRPNEKMVRSVCLDCHGLGFTLDALADPALVRTNFTGRPARHVESLDLAARRLLETQSKQTKP